MRIPMVFFGIAMIFITFFLKARRSGNSQIETYEQFIDEERSANFIRRRDPPPEDYLIADTNTLPVREYPDDPKYNRVRSRQQDALTLAKLPMLYLCRGLNNREIKMKYGTANLDMIITYEENYNRFIHSLLEWASALISLGSHDDAAEVLEAAIDCHCDRSQAYTLLADIYAQRGESQKLAELESLSDENLDAKAGARALAYINNVRLKLESKREV